ncbi:glutamate receptor ionotropic [Striga asiatica]|uniref:Glutamate receptor ionotropic n=1 Tax=Striga asiatica TaxID=4170 RepID=A0A5A7QQU0_STRAF|nr:glutamate receptor ionotropic [Striga asiatica]
MDDRRAEVRWGLWASHASRSRSTSPQRRRRRPAPRLTSTGKLTSRNVTEHGGVEKVGDGEPSWRRRRRREEAVVGREVEVERRRRRGGEVGLGLGAAEGPGGAVVGHGGLLGGVEGAEPHARLLPRVADLRRVPAPRPLPNAPVVALPRGRHGR